MIKNTFSVFSILFLLTIFLGENVTAQLIADAGPNNSICPMTLSESKEFIGGNPSVTGGTGPYKYSWSFSNITKIGSRIIHASEILNDTSIANPIIENSFDDTLKFKLIATDANGLTAID